MFSPDEIGLYADDNELSQRYYAIGLERVPNILKSRLIASQRTLESKISESGQPRIRIPPHAITYALYELEKAGYVRRLRRSDSVPCSLFFLSSTKPEKLSTRFDYVIEQQQLLHHALSREGPNSVGKLAEEIVRKSFKDCGFFNIDRGWGNVTKFNSIEMPMKHGRPSATDGGLFLKNSPNNEPAVVEVKNRRRWISPTGLI